MVRKYFGNVRLQTDALYHRPKLLSALDADRKVYRVP